MANSKMYATALRVLNRYIASGRPFTVQDVFFECKEVCPSHAPTLITLGRHMAKRRHWGHVRKVGKMTNLYRGPNFRTSHTIYRGVNNGK